MKTLFITPFPPPVTGQSIAVKIFHNELIKFSSIECVNLSKDSFKPGVNSFVRIIQIAKILKEVWCKKKGVDVIYFTISESLAGNAKDLLIYLLCFSQLSKMIIHLHGGAGMRVIILGNNGILRRLNEFFIRRLRAAIVLGKSHVEIFAHALPREKIHIVPNFSEDYLFSNREDIEHKFQKTTPLRILFLSNLIPGKGYNELLDAFFALDEHLRESVLIDFAGGFESEEQKSAFLDRIKEIRQVCYHGTVHGEYKRDLLSRAHIFCLPTYYPYEGQPISILEAYASGCFVITTDHSGIRDIFLDNINGYEVCKKSVPDLKENLIKVLDNRDNLLNFALTNFEYANKFYRVSIYNSKLVPIFIGNDIFYASPN